MVYLILFCYERISKISSHGKAEVAIHFNISNKHTSITWVCSILITLSGDIAKDPGRTPSSCDTFSGCHWNLNNISAHNFIKISLLRSTHNFDILYFSETYLDSSISSYNVNLIYIYRRPYKSNATTLNMGVCIYYKNFLPLKVVDIHSTSTSKYESGKIYATSYIVHQANLKMTLKHF